ncbi:MAG: glycosyltransferase family 4 protein [Deltaproteobacteria bacterium]|nr:glycosyltransferase family 4 protein [Deltaproteobacteria bacterium]
MKIIYLVASSDISGGQRVIFQQAEELAKGAHTVILACPEPEPAWFSISSAKWAVTPFSKSRPLPEADIRVATYWTTVTRAVQAFDGPVFHLCQGYEADFSFNKQCKKEIETAYAIPTHKLAVSPHVAGRLKSVGYDRVSYIGQTFDAHEFPPSKRREFHLNPPTILLPGIFEADVKGIREALEALAKLREMGISFHLHRVSTLPRSETEIGIFKAHEYSMRLPPSEMAYAYHQSDILIGPSHPEEGFGLHVLEALSSGLPVLISNTPGHRHIAGHAADYFKCGESIDIFLQLESLLQTPSRLRELSQLGPLAARRFNTAKVANRLIRLFNRSLRQNKDF